MQRLADKYLPDYHFSERHAIRIKGSVQDVFNARDDFDFGRYKLIRFLFGVRGLPSRLSKQDMKSINFIELEKIPSKQLAIGLIGQFWKVNGNLLNFEAAEFINLHPEGFTKAVWTFCIDRAEPGITLLSTETRILCIGENARKKFRRYWFLIRPFSGLIRKIMLRGIKKIVEQGSVPNSRGDVPLRKTRVPPHSSH